MTPGDRPYRGADRRNPGRQQLPYVGVDRRRAPASGVPTASSDRRVLVALVAVCAALAAVLLAHDGLTALGLAGDVERLAAVAAVVTGVVALVRWLHTGEAAAVLLGAALLAAGSGPVLLGPLAALLHSDPVLVALAPLPHALASLPALALVVRAVRTDVVVSTLRPAAVVLLPALVLLGTALLLVLLSGPLQDALPPAAVAASNAVVAVAWSALALVSRRSAPLREVLPRVPLVLALLALADVLRVAAAGAPGLLHLLAAGTDLAACVLAACSVTGGLLRVVRRSGSQSMQLLVSLHAAERQLHDVTQDEDARTHDVRATLAGVRAALAVSARQGQGGPRGLHDSVVAELSRIEQLLGGRREERPREVLLAEVLEPVLATELAQGLALRVDLGDVRALAAPAALAGAVQNLLANVRRHAPGASVLVSARSTGRTVELAVADDGPGIPPDQRPLVLVRGVRREDSGGQGHGLANASAAVTASGGALRVEEAPGGGAAFVLELPGVEPESATA